MRIAFVIAAGAALWAQAASAATIVQTDSEEVGLAFQGFDSSLGVLNSVTLDVQVTKHRTWWVRAPLELHSTVTATWDVAGTWQHDARSNAIGAFTSGFTVPLTGSGSTEVPLEGEYSDGDVGGLLVLTASGSGSFALPVEPFYDRTLFNGRDTGMYDGSDTTLSFSPDATAGLLTGWCRGEMSGEDNCGSVIYQLTFDYTPAAEIGAVPEPSSWAMMLLGFGFVGGAMRSAKRKQRLTVSYA